MKYVIPETYFSADSGLYEIYENEFGNLHIRDTYDFQINSKEDLFDVKYKLYAIFSFWDARKYEVTKNNKQQLEWKYPTINITFAPNLTIDLENEDWVPINDFNVIEYYGKLHHESTHLTTPTSKPTNTSILNVAGNGVRIKNLKSTYLAAFDESEFLSLTFANCCASGLFGCIHGNYDTNVEISGITIENVTLVGSNVYTTPSANHRSCCAGLCCFMQNANVSNCHVTGEIINISGGWWSGPLVGNAYAVNIRNCSVDASNAQKNVFKYTVNNSGQQYDVNILSHVFGNPLVIGKLGGICGTLGEAGIIENCSVNGLYIAGDGCAGISPILSLKNANNGKIQILNNHAENVVIHQLPDPYKHTPTSIADIGSCGFIIASGIGTLETYSDDDILEQIIINDNALYCAGNTVENCNLYFSDNPFFQITDDTGFIFTNLGIYNGASRDNVIAVLNNYFNSILPENICSIDNVAVQPVLGDWVNTRYATTYALFDNDLLFNFWEDSKDTVPQHLIVGTKEWADNNLAMIVHPDSEIIYQEYPTEDDVVYIIKAIMPKSSSDNIEFDYGSCSQLQDIPLTTKCITASNMQDLITQINNRFAAATDTEIANVSELFDKIIQLTNEIEELKNK